ncbi:MAG: cache domain-containing protein [Jiangellaceae bacterium]
MTERRDASDAAAVIGDVIERVFASVEHVRDLMSERYQDAVSRGESLTDADLCAIGPSILELLSRPGEVAVGMGLIVEPGLLPSHPLRMEWWQWGSGKEGPAPLEVDLHPDSLGFYDYAAAEWFSVPRRTRKRHIVGPYVDVHGTDRYVLTLTVPVEVAGTFLGVAGADVPVTRFETLVLRRLGRTAGNVVLVNNERRIVLSTSARWITGSLLPPAEESGSIHAMAQLPWQLLVPAAPERG